METIQHENAVKLKASTFVGRTKLVEKAFKHCTTVQNTVQNKNKLFIELSGFSGTTIRYPNTMILHGEPGCGKSGLLANVAVLCSKKVQEDKDFLFIHAVDTCPGSNVLEGKFELFTP